MIGRYPIGTVAVASLAAGDALAMPSAGAQLLADRYAERLHTIEVSPLHNVSEQPVPLFWADRDYTTTPDDTLPNQPFEGRVNQAFTFTQRLPLGLLGGEATANAGEVTVFIGDGKLDGLLDYIWEGRTLTVKVGIPPTADLPGLPYADFVTIFTGIIQTKPEATREVMTLRLRDAKELLQQPIQTATYAGTGGLEGPPELKGTTKPLAYGDLIGVPAICIDPTNLVYQWSASSVLNVAVGGVKDRGAPLTFDPGPVTFSGVWNGVGPGTVGLYRTDLTNGLIQLGGAPDGPITVDGFGKARGTATELLLTMFQDLYPTLTLDEASFLTESRGANAYAYIQDAQTWTELAPKMLGGQGSVLVPDRLGRIIVVTLRTDQTPTATITEDRILESGIEIQTTPNPAWRLRVQFLHNWSPIDKNASAGALGAPTKEALARPYLERLLHDESLKTLYLLAEDSAPLVAYLVDVDDGNGSEFARLFNLVRAPRRLYRVPMIGRPFTMTLGQSVQLPVSRPLTYGAWATIVTIEEDAQTNVVTLEVLV